MADSDTYRTIKSVSNGLYKEKGSRFLAEAYPVSSEDEIKSILETVRKIHHSARHHCYAYLLGTECQLWRVNDDGEPSGTAGKPILGQIKSHGITNVLVVVSRYFGGTLLGVSGLINAYRSAAASSLDGSEIIENYVQEFYEVTYPFSAMNGVMKILKSENVKYSQNTFDLECSITIGLRLSARDRILSRLTEFDGLRFRLLPNNWSS